MKPTDLRIGNYVRIKDSREIVRVCGLTSKKIRYHRGNDRSTNLSSRRYCEIEDVLIFDHWRESDCRNLYWRDDFDDGKWYGYYGCERAIRYIHELQNLHHALTGEELKIEL